MKRLATGIILASLLAAPAYAQSLSVNMGDASLSGRTVQLVVMLTALSIAPGLLMMVTSFPRVIVALSLLRNGMGTQGTPPNTVLISLALFLTAYIMAPTFNDAWKNGIQPLTVGKVTEEVAFERTATPFKTFMLKHTREADLKLFLDLAKERPVTAADASISTIAPAFLISELRRGFEIGFMLLLPFLVIDLAVAAILMSMNMMMLPPITVSLPVKLIFFVLIDGWNLVAGALVRSYA